MNIYLCRWKYCSLGHINRQIVRKWLKCFIVQSVYTVNTKDYTAEQLNVWVTEQVDMGKWNQSFHEDYTIVAVESKIIVGFGDIDRTGYMFTKIIREKVLLQLFAMNWRAKSSSDCYSCFYYRKTLF